MQSPIRLAIVAAVLVTAACSTKPADTTAQNEKQFQEMLTGATLIGHSTRTNKEGLAPGEERYTIDKVSKLTGDTWLFQARIQYGSHDLPLPIPVTIKWAGDTPVITLTDLKLPGLGTFTARILLYRDRYAGTWSGGDHGGEMFGKIERVTPKK